MFKKCKQSGFSLAEIMVSLGLLGAVSLGVMNLSQNIQKDQTRAILATELSEVSNSIAQLLLQQEACTHTLGVGSRIEDNLELSSIKHSNAVVAFNKGGNYANNRIEISSINITNVQLDNLNNGPNKYGSAKINVLFKKKSRVISGPSEVRKRYLVQVETDSSNRLIKCFSATQNAVLTATEASCSAADGIWNPTTGTCSFPQYVLNSGDSMQGALEAPELRSTGLVSAGQKICIGNACRSTFAQQVCPSGSVATKIGQDGSMICSSITCSNNTYFYGLKPNGQPDCRLIPTGSCGVNEYVTKVQPDGSIICSPLPAKAKIECPGESFLKGINADGSPICSRSCTGVNARTVYEKSRVISPDSCKSIGQTRTCNTTNGTWSAWSPKSSYTSSSCTQQPTPAPVAKSCSGSNSRTVYEKTSVLLPERCKSIVQTRTCNIINGTWSAWSPSTSYNKTSCSVSQCVDTTWYPTPATTCAGTRFTQTSNCGNTRIVFGSMDCSFDCVDVGGEMNANSGCYDGNYEGEDGIYW